MEEEPACWLRRLDGGVGEAKLPPLRAKEEEALPTAPTGRGGRSDDDVATIGCSLLHPPNESGQVTTRTDEEALPSAQRAGREN